MSGELFDRLFLAISDCRAEGIPLSSGVPKLKTFIKYWLPVGLWMILIFSASGDGQSYQHSSKLFIPLLHWLFPWMSQALIENLHYLVRKCAHLSEYAILALLLWRAIRQPKKNDPRPWRWPEAGLALAIVFLYSASDELHQVFVPSRTGLVSDVFIDTIGGAAGLLLLWLLGKVFKRW